MKRSTKITLRTKIYLTIVGLLALTGALYAATPIFFTQFPQATGVAVSRFDMYATPWCDQRLVGVDCMGNFSTLGMIPFGIRPCMERYMAIAPAQSANAGFTPRDLFIAEGENIYKFSGGAITFFAHLDLNFRADHSSLTFDHVGTFGNKMIVLVESGATYTIDGNANVTFIAEVGPYTEGPAIPPLSFGPLGGQILVADEHNGQVHAIKNDGTVTRNAFNWSPPLGKGAENVNVIPSIPCTFGCTNGTFFQMIYYLDYIIYYPPTDFQGLGGNVIVTSEAEPPETAMGTVLVRFNAETQTYDTTLFDGTFSSTINEGAYFVDCDVPSVITPCALASCTPPYPFVSENPRTNVAFNESEVLRGFRMAVDANCIPQTLQMFYNDEHAMTLGVNQVQVASSCGTTTTSYPISLMLTNPDSAIPPIVGSTIPSGDQAGIDVVERPMFPAMYVTDVTANPGNPLAGDWQFGGTAIPPDATFGTWKGAFRTVDKLSTPNKITITPGGDPAENDWNLGPGSDPVPPGLVNEGYGNECRWNLTTLNLIPGHQYRLYFMVHDGDSNNVGGDVGQACVIFTMPGIAPPPTPTPTASPTPTPTPTTTPGVVTVIARAFGLTRSAKTVTVTFRNDTTVGQVLTGLSITWPQAINGNLTKIQMGGTTIYNTSTGGGTLTIPPPPLSGTVAQRTIAADSCATLTFTFANNVSTNPTNYTGSATFDPFGNVTMF